MKFTEKRACYSPEFDDLLDAHVQIIHVRNVADDERQRRECGVMSVQGGACNIG